jgi:signal transduction histidine kinase
MPEAGAVNRKDVRRQISRLPARARRSLAWRLMAAYLSTSLFILIALSLAVYFFTAYYLESRFESELAAQADFYASYAASLARDERGLAALAPAMVDLFAPQADLNVRFFGARNGALLAATQDIGAQPGRAALAELGYRTPALFTQASRDLPGRRYAARAITVGEPGELKTIGVVEVSRLALASETFLAGLRRILLVSLLASGAASILVSAIVARRLSGPIRDMEAATQRVAAGDLAVRLGEYRPDELGRLAASINHMSRQLAELEAARTRFVGEIAHDLRTPLAGIKGLLVNLIDAARPAERASLELVEQETDRLVRLVNQLLDFSRWQAGDLELNRQPVDIGAVARAAASLSQARAQHRGIGLAVHVPPGLPPLAGDADRLERVILNLLDNAIKFTPGGGQVALCVERRADGAGEVEVSVQDTGPGMAPEECERAFDAYYRGDRGGAGLGLSISRAIVEAHGGRMGIQSEAGRGSRVWFTLPL